MSEYERRFARTKAVLSKGHIEALGAEGVRVLYDAVMIMAFADGEISDDEGRFLNDFTAYLDNPSSGDDLTPEALIERVKDLELPPATAEAFVKVLLIVADIDDDFDAAELAMFYDLCAAIGITRERTEEMRALLSQARAETKRLNDQDETRRLAEETVRRLGGQ